MADISVAYLIGSARLVEDVSGTRFTEGYLVQNVSGRFALIDARGAPGIPRMGDPLEGHAELQVVNRTPKPFKNSKTDVVLEVTYGPPDVGGTTIDKRVRFHGTTRSFLTNKHRDGSIIKVEYTDADNNHAVQPAVIGEVEGTKAEGVLTFNWTSTTDPEYLVDYLNCLNSSAWRRGAKYTWLCADVQIEEAKYKGGWDVEISFLYDADTHIKPAFYRNEFGHIPEGTQTWKPIIDTDGRNGWTNGDLNDLADFNKLKLPSNF
jgi:hypothetical protein